MLHIDIYYFAMKYYDNMIICIIISIKTYIINWYNILLILILLLYINMNILNIITYRFHYKL